MPRKKAVEVKPEIELAPAVTSEIVDVTDVLPEIEKAGETAEMIWVETVDAYGRRMIQVPKN